MRPKYCNTKISQNCLVGSLGESEFDKKPKTNAKSINARSQLRNEIFFFLRIMVLEVNSFFLKLIAFKIVINLPVCLYVSNMMVQKPLCQIQSCPVDVGAEDVVAELVPGVEHVGDLLPAAVVPF